MTAARNSVENGSLPTGSGRLTRVAATCRYRFADVEFDERSGILKVGGAEVAVEPRPLQLLSELLHRPGEVVSKDELLDVLWDGRPTVDNVLANAVNKLRKALGEAGAARLVTVPRVGYRLEGPIDRVVLDVPGSDDGFISSFVRGQPVPSRADFIFDRPLDAARGLVWLARKPRSNAVSVFKFAFDSERLTALKREYTLYRVLRSELGDRNDFARIVSAHFASAPFFLECEYGGEDLLGWAKEAGQLQSLTTAERVGLFLQIAKAVAAAHNVGVLHKDLKPANVLISAASGGSVWMARLTDFGSSRLLDPGRLAELGVTAMGLTVTQGLDAQALGGTPLYLAPELLAGGAPNAQSDLYALGLMLYQLLAGDLRRPLATGWQRDIDDELLRDDITAATEGKPGERLASVAALVERLGALDARRAQRVARQREDRLNDEARQQLQRSRARRPWILAALACLGVGLAASLWFQGRTNVALRRSDEEAARAQSVTDFLTKDVLQSADVLHSSRAKLPSALEIVQRASAKAGERFRNQPRTEAAVRYQLAQIFMRMYSRIYAERELAAAQARLAGVVPRTDPQWLSVRYLAIRLMVRNYDVTQASRLLPELESDAAPLLHDVDTELALLALQTRVELMLLRRENDAALPLALQAVSLGDRIVPFDTAARLDQRKTLAALYARLGRQTDLENLLSSMLKPPFDADGAGNVAFAEAKIDLALTLIRDGKSKSAERELLDALDRLLASVGPDDFQTGRLQYELAYLYESVGDFDRAVTAWQASLHAFLAALGEQHQAVLITQTDLARERINQGQAAAGLQALNDTEPRLVAVVRGDYRTLMATVAFDRARALTTLDRPLEAIKALDPLTPADFGMGTREKGWRWKLQAERGRALMRLGRKTEGAALVREAVAAMDREGESWPWVVEQYRRLLSAEAASASSRS